LVLSWLFYLFNVANSFQSSRDNLNNLGVMLSLSQGALAVASAYAIGGSITLLFQALLFVVLYSPYEVGDIVMIRSFGEETFDEGMLKVVDIAVSTTTLESQQGHVIQMSNAMLMSRKIVNLTRSGHATIVVKFTVGYHTSREQLNCFADKLKQYVRRHTVDWKPTVNMQVMSADVTGPMELEVVVQHVKTWKDQDEISVSRGKLIQAAIHYMIVSWAFIASALLQEGSSLSLMQRDAITLHDIVVAGAQHSLC
jgi:small-conductance mechanosensitive channel